MDPLMKGIGVSSGWIQWSFMIIAPGGFFMLAIFIWVANNLAASKVAHSK
jgi:Na+-transporting NADH:ubiquinone oxidoreductase subunit NqrD